MVDNPLIVSFGNGWCCVKYPDGLKLICQRPSKSVKDIKELTSSEMEKIMSMFMDFMSKREDSEQE